MTDADAIVAGIAEAKKASNKVSPPLADDTCQKAKKTYAAVLLHSAARAFLQSMTILLPGQTGIRVTQTLL